MTVGVLGGAVTSDDPGTVGGGGTGIANRIAFWTNATDIGPDAVVTDGAGAWSSIASLTINDGAVELGLAGSPVAGEVIIGGDAGGAARPTRLRVDAASNVFFEIAGNERVNVTSTIIRVSLPTLDYTSSIDDVFFRQAATTTDSGGSMSVIARDSTAAASVGADLVERSGDGVASDGDVLLSKGTTLSLLSTTGNNLQLGGTVAAATRPTDINVDADTLIDLQIANTSVLDLVADKVDCKEPFFRSANGAFVEEILAGGRTIVETTDPDTLLFDPEDADRLVTLPPEAASDGLFYWIRNTGNTAANLNVQDDTPTAIVSIPSGSGALLKCNGVAWRQAGSDRLPTLHALIEDRAPVESTASDVFVTLASAAATVFSGRPLLCFVSVMLFPSVANTGVQFAIQIDAGADAVASQMLLQETEHSAVPGQVIVAPTAGSHTLRIRWRRMGGAGTLTLDANDQILLHAIEL